LATVAKNAWIGEEMSDNLRETRIKFWIKRIKEDRRFFAHNSGMYLVLKMKASELWQQLMEQGGLFNQACECGSITDIEDHGAALCRGYLWATDALDRPGYVPETSKATREAIRRFTNGQKAQGQASQPGDGRANQ
jgi:hypothetical protein